jgi:phosphopantetheinyl transferase (holo-ACP synthase)
MKALGTDTPRRVLRGIEVVRRWTAANTIPWWSRPCRIPRRHRVLPTISHSRDLAIAQVILVRDRS